MKKKILITVFVLSFFIIFLIFGTYKASPKVLIQNDGGLEILSSEQSLSIASNTDSINVFSCVVKNIENQNQQYLIYVTNEKNIFGKTFYKTITSHICELENINQENSIPDNFLATSIGNDDIVYYGIAPENCEKIFINDKELTIEKRTIVFDEITSNFVFYYGIFNENEIIKNSYYIDGLGKTHEFEPSVLYF